MFGNILVEGSGAEVVEVWLCNAMSDAGRSLCGSMEQSLKWSQRLEW